MVSSVNRALRAGILAIVVLGFAGAANAQQAPSAANIKLAREVVELSRTNLAFNQIIPQVFQQAFQTYVQQNPDLQKDLKEVLLALVPEFEKRKEEVALVLATSYANVFSEDELKALLAFYSSPVGKKYTEQQQAIIQNASQSIQAFGSKLSQDLIVRLKAEMKKRGHTI